MSDKDFAGVLQSTKRKVEVSEDDRKTYIYVDGVLAMRILNRGSALHISMLPDLFTFGEWKGLFETRNVHFSVKVEDHLTVSLEAVEGTTMLDVANAVVSAIEELNLYGYITD